MRRAQCWIAPVGPVAASYLNLIFGGEKIWSLVALLIENNPRSKKTRAALGGRGARVG